MRVEWITFVMVISLVVMVTSVVGVLDMVVFRLGMS